MRSAESHSTEDCPVKMKLIAPPLYVLTTQTLDKQQGVEVLNQACEACKGECAATLGRLCPACMTQPMDLSFMHKLRPSADACLLDMHHHDSSIIPPCRLCTACSLHPVHTTLMHIQLMHKLRPFAAAICR